MQHDFLLNLCLFCFVMLFCMLFILFILFCLFVVAVVVYTQCNVNVNPFAVYYGAAVLPHVFCKFVHLCRLI